MKRLEYRRGMEAMRQAVWATFHQLGDAEMTGYTAAEITRNAAPVEPR